MTVQHAPNNRSRNLVAWVGTDVPPDATTFAQAWRFIVRDLHDDDVASQNMTHLALVIFDCTPDSFEAIQAKLVAIAEPLLDLDCRVSLRVDPRVRANLISLLDELRLPVGQMPQDEARRFAWQKTGEAPYPNICVFNESATLADLLRPALESPPLELPKNNVSVVQNLPGATLRPADIQLVRRAFADCSSVHLEPMPGGRSGVSTLRAHPEKISDSGRWPQTVFAKIGSREQIQREYDNYVAYVEPYLSFDLGPHIIRARCYLGAKRGILVGNFVEEAESLKDCVRAGRSASAIACLFDRTLLGWHRGATIVRQQHTLGEALFKDFATKVISQRRVDHAIHLGATLQYRALRALLRQFKSVNILMGHTHGDLHVGNILVRDGNAILIDFAACAEQKPILRDAAMLEASLLTDVLTKGLCPDTPRWLSEVAPLYTAAPMTRSAPPPLPRSRLAWYFSCVRQIRLYASRLETEPDQYAAMLASALLFKASKDPYATGFKGEARAMAYVLAEKILKSHQAPSQAPQPAAAETAAVATGISA